MKAMPDIKPEYTDLQYGRNALQGKANVLLIIINYKKRQEKNRKLCEKLSHSSAHSFCSIYVPTSAEGSDQGREDGGGVECEAVVPGI
jgi:hypothetical protein